MHLVNLKMLPGRKIKRIMVREKGIEIAVQIKKSIPQQHFREIIAHSMEIYHR